MTDVNYRGAGITMFADDQSQDYIVDRVLGC
jgi:hypothetical protein